MAEGQLYEGSETDKPRGNCYELATNTVLAHGSGRFGHLLVGENWADKVPRDAQRVVLVHGTPVLARPPYKRYGHAWVEFAVNGVDLVVDGHLGLMSLKGDYYRSGQIEERHVRRYTKSQAVKMILKYKHYGRWEE